MLNRKLPAIKALTYEIIETETNATLFENMINEGTLFEVNSKPITNSINKFPNKNLKNQAIPKWLKNDQTAKLPKFEI